MEKITSIFEKLVPFLKDSNVLKIWKFLNQLIFILTNLFFFYSFFVLFLYKNIQFARHMADLKNAGFLAELVNAFSFTYLYAFGPIIILILINISFKINKMIIKKLQE